MSHTLIFLHIPKTGGTTMTTALLQNYRQREIYSCSASTAEDSGFANLSEKERFRYRCIRGHIYHGFHKHVRAPYRYITMLRDPVDRMVSYYFYARRQTGHYLYDRINREGIDLEKFVHDDVSPEIFNGHVRQLSGMGHGGRPTASHLADAIQNMNHPTMTVGMQEEFDRSLLLFAKVNDWKRISYRNENITQSRLHDNEIPGPVRRMLEDKNALDFQLRQKARQKFETDCARFDIDSSEEFDFQTEHIGSYLYRVRRLEDHAYDWVQHKRSQLAATTRRFLTRPPG